MARPGRDHVPGLRLTERVLGVLRLVAKGMNNREIARALFISENPVRTHARNPLESRHPHSRLQFAVFAVPQVPDV